MQFEIEERERIAREEMDRKMAESIAKGTRTLPDSDSDITIDPNSPNHEDLASDVDSDITVDESGEAETIIHKNKESKPSLQKNCTKIIEKLFGSDLDDDQCK